MSIANLTPKQEKLLIALMSQPTVTKAYEAAGIAKKTAYKYMRDPTFKSEWDKLRRETMTRTSGLLLQASADAVLTLHEVATSKSVSPTARVLASRAILEMGFKAHELLTLEDIQERLQALEKNDEV